MKFTESTVGDAALECLVELEYSVFHGPEIALGEMASEQMGFVKVLQERLRAKLTEAELRLVRQRLLELAAQNQDIELCNQAALDGAMMLDRMEDDDARRQSR